MSGQQYLSISEADYLGEYKIRFTFSDGKQTTVDFYDFLSQSQHSEIKKYLDTELFQNYTLSDGDINWNDFDLIFPIYDLYHNQINKRVDAEVS